MRLGTANIRNFPDMTARQVAEDAVVVMGHTSMCGLQEITPGEDSDVIHEVLHGAWQLIGARSTCPFLVNARTWLTLSHDVQRTKRPKLDRPENPHHDMVGIVVQSVKRRHLPPFAVVNTHLVAGGYNAQHEQSIQRVWDEEWERFVQFIQSYRARGLSVFVLGDLNNPRPPEVQPRAHFGWLTPAKSPDHIGILEHQDSVDMLGAEHTRVSLNSDHDLHVIQGPLSRSDG